MINVEYKHFSLVSMSLQSEKFVALQVKMNRPKVGILHWPVLNKMLHFIICLIMFQPCPIKW